MGLLFYLLLFWLLSLAYNSFLLTPRQKVRRQLSMLAAHLSERLQWDSDLLSDAERRTMIELRDGAKQQLKAPKAAATPTLPAAPAGAGAPPPATTAPLSPDAAYLAAANERLARIHGRTSFGAVREVLELLVVVFGVVLGIRGLFLQPFKIPTGSMQPTLFGVHFVPELPGVQLNAVQNLFAFVNYGRRYVNESTATGGRMNLSAGSITPYHRGGLGTFLDFFLPQSTVQVGEHLHVLPGLPVEVQKYLLEMHRAEPLPGLAGLDPLDLPAGAAIASGYLQQGDHLFVDLMSYHFIEPKRGDIVVFLTDGITFDARPLSGRYFVKRLVGMPGETLQIRDRQLYVKARGASEFRPLDERDGAGFAHLYSYRRSTDGQGLYAGHSHPSFRGRYLLDDTATFELGPDQYFMMGDNTDNSQDSRYWGIVPRENIVGRAVSVWWPFTPRWGLTDRVAPHGPLGPFAPKELRLATPREVPATPAPPSRLPPVTVESRP